MYDTPRVAIRTIGELFITIGVVLILFLIYQLWWTTFTADRAAESARDELIWQWSQEITQPVPEASSSVLPSAGQASAVPRNPITPQMTVQSMRDGKAFALMYIPRLQSQVWGTPIVKGIGPESLARGIGYYPDSAAPGSDGNFAVAGHRATHGEPFRNIDQLRIGDEVFVRTRDAWFTYQLVRDELVKPKDTWVIDPVPRGFKPGALMTIITCHPRWASTHRWIWWAQLLETSPADQPPAQVS